MMMAYPSLRLLDAGLTIPSGKAIVYPLARQRRELVEIQLPAVAARKTHPPATAPAPASNRSPAPESAFVVTTENKDASRYQMAASLPL